MKHSFNDGANKNMPSKTFKIHKFMIDFIIAKGLICPQEIIDVRPFNCANANTDQKTVLKK